VSLTSLSAANKVYDGTTVASITAGSIATGVGSETLQVSGVGSFSDSDGGASPLYLSDDSDGAPAAVQTSPRAILFVAWIPSRPAAFVAVVSAGLRKSRKPIYLPHPGEVVL
jgi:hypothetical protein